jgi:hypothetical protein
MKLDFVTLEVRLQATPLALQQAIVTQLHCYGEPLRWAVTRVDGLQQLATVEAVVIQPDPECSSDTH